jgi:DNA-binding NarL/FixJ family response regulator
MMLNKQGELQEAISIVIVEDHCMTLAGLNVTLGSDEYAELQILGTASDAASGLELCQKLAPNVVLLDLHLPGSPPKSTVEAFCSKCPDSKVLVYSAETRIAFVQAVLKSGAAGYLLKSEPTARLVDVIKKIAIGAVDHPIVSRDLFKAQQSFSKAEQQILRLLAQGKKYKDIASERGTAISTVRSQCDFLQMSLELKTREELIAWAVQNGFGNL